jgi:PPOX class probable F420-dependent enzyme
MDATRVIESELGREILGARLIANLATFNEDDSIHLVPMWFLWQDGVVLMPTSGSSRKAQNLARDPRASVMVDDSRGALDVRGITLSGRAEILRGASAAGMNARIHGKYITEAGLELAPVADALEHDDVTVLFVPEQGNMWDLRGYEASRLVLERGEFQPLVPVHSR